MSEPEIPPGPRAHLIHDVRLPRVLLAAVVMLCLAASYAFLQWGHYAKAVTHDERMILEVMRQRIVMPRARLMADSIATLDAQLDSLLGPKPR